MHIPDGFLDAKTALATGAFSVAGLGASLRQAARHLQSRRIPLVGLCAAFIFVAQMLNFPVAGGTSGHLLGATLAAVLLGPSAAIIVMSSVVIVQSFIFADGGVLALGANVLNMAIVAPLCGYGVYRTFRLVLKGQQGQLVAAGFASWVATVVAAIFCSGELASSGTTLWSTALPAMVGIHMLIGLGESAMTMLVLAAIGSTRPELLAEDSRAMMVRGRVTTFVYPALIVIGLLLLVAPHASTLPDGLEKVAASLGFEKKAIANSVPAPLSKYELPGIQSSAAAMMAAGLIGAVAVFALSFLLARVIIPRRKASAPLTSAHRQ